MPLPVNLTKRIMVLMVGTTSGGMLISLVQWLMLLHFQL